jgi:hypothetical protein
MESSGTAKDTGLIFVSNEKTNNITVLAPMIYKVVKDIKTSRRPATCTSARIAPSSTSHATTMTS